MHGGCLEWDAAAAVQQRLDPLEALQLEVRGVTQQTKPASAPQTAQFRQADLWRRQTIHKNTVAAKLREAGANDLAAKLELCHSYYTVVVCNECGVVRKFPNRCDLFCCPECQHGLARDRARQVSWWVNEVKQPKHVVLTVTNTTSITANHVDEFRGWFTKLRRRSFANNWRGGFYSLEVTNEGKGWHLHLHALVDARWIDAGELASQWESITHGLGHIVKVMDCRQQDYLHEVTKYSVKGSQLAAWQPEMILQFVTAFAGKRTFGVFGSLYGKRTEFAEWIAELKSARPRCDCGSCNVTYFSEAEWLIYENAPGPAPKPRPPPATDQQICLIPAVHDQRH